MEWVDILILIIVIILAILLAAILAYKLSNKSAMNEFAGGSEIIGGYIDPFESLNLVDEYKNTPFIYHNPDDQMFEGGSRYMRMPRLFNSNDTYTFEILGTNILKKLMNEKKAKVFINYKVYVLNNWIPYITTEMEEDKLNIAMNTSQFLLTSPQITVSNMKEFQYYFTIVYNNTVYVGSGLPPNNTNIDLTKIRPFIFQPPLFKMMHIPNEIGGCSDKYYTNIVADKFTMLYPLTPNINDIKINITLKLLDINQYNNLKPDNIKLYYGTDILNIANSAIGIDCTNKAIKSKEHYINFELDNKFNMYGNIYYYFEIKPITTVTTSLSPRVTYLSPGKLSAIKPDEYFSFTIAPAPYIKKSPQTLGLMSEQAKAKTSIIDEPLKKRIITEHPEPIPKLDVVDASGIVWHNPAESIIDISKNCERTDLASRIIPDLKTMRDPVNPNNLDDIYIVLRAKETAIDKIKDTYLRCFQPSLNLYIDSRYSYKCKDKTNNDIYYIYELSKEFDIGKQIHYYFEIEFSLNNRNETGLLFNNNILYKAIGTPKCEANKCWTFTISKSAKITELPKSQKTVISELLNLNNKMSNISNISNKLSTDTSPNDVDDDTDDLLNQINNLNDEPLIDLSQTAAVGAIRANIENINKTLPLVKEKLINNANNLRANRAEIQSTNDNIQNIIKPLNNNIKQIMQLVEQEEAIIPVVIETPKAKIGFTETKPKPSEYILSTTSTPSILRTTSATPPTSSTSATPPTSSTSATFASKYKSNKKEEDEEHYGGANTAYPIMQNIVRNGDPTYIQMLKIISLYKIYKHFEYLSPELNVLQAKLKEIRGGSDPVVAHTPLTAPVYAPLNAYLDEAIGKFLKTKGYDLQKFNDSLNLFIGYLRRHDPDDKLMSHKDVQNVTAIYNNILAEFNIHK